MERYGVQQASRCIAAVIFSSKFSMQTQAQSEFATSPLVIVFIIAIKKI